MSASGIDYIDRSIAVMSSIDPDELATRELGNLIGHNDRQASYRTRTFAVGEISAGKSLIFAAVKDVESPAKRALMELREVTFVSSRIPEISEMVPKFVGLIAIEGQAEPVAIITEDASKNGEHRVHESWLESEIVKLFSTRFSDIEHLELLDRDALERGTTFSVGETQRMLDVGSYFFWPNLNLFKNPEYDLADERAKNAISKVTVELPADSTLAKSISLARSSAL